MISLFVSHKSISIYDDFGWPYDKLTVDELGVEQ